MNKASNTTSSHMQYWNFWSKEDLLQETSDILKEWTNNAQNIY